MSINVKTDVKVPLELYSAIRNGSPADLTGKDIAAINSLAIEALFDAIKTQQYESETSAAYKRFAQDSAKEAPAPSPSQIEEPVRDGAQKPPSQGYASTNVAMHDIYRLQAQGSSKAYTSTADAMADLRRLQARGGPKPRPGGVTAGPSGRLDPPATDTHRSDNVCTMSTPVPASASSSGSNAFASRARTDSSASAADQMTPHPTPEKKSLTDQNIVSAAGVDVAGINTFDGIRDHCEKKLFEGTLTPEDGMRYMALEIAELRSLNLNLGEPKTEEAAASFLATKHDLRIRMDSFLWSKVLQMIEEAFQQWQSGLNCPPEDCFWVVGAGPSRSPDPDGIKVLEPPFRTAKLANTAVDILAFQVWHTLALNLEPMILPHELLKSISPKGGRMNRLCRLDGALALDTYVVVRGGAEAKPKTSEAMWSGPSPR